MFHFRLFFHVIRCNGKKNYNPRIISIIKVKENEKQYLKNYDFNSKTYLKNIEKLIFVNFFQCIFSQI